MKRSGNGKRNWLLCSARCYASIGRGIKQRTRPRGGFKRVASVQRFCRAHDEVRNFLRPRSWRNERVSLAQRWLLYTARPRVLLTSLAVA